MLPIPLYKSCEGQLESWQKAYNNWEKYYNDATAAIKAFNVATSKAVDALQPNNALETTIGADLVCDAWNAYQNAADTVALANALTENAQSLNEDLIGCYSDYKVALLESNLGNAELIEEPPD
jgi:hypothetical protein